MTFGLVQMQNPVLERPFWKPSSSAGSTWAKELAFGIDGSISDQELSIKEATETVWDFLDHYLIF